MLIDVHIRVTTTQIDLGQMHPKNAMETIEVGHTPEIDQGNGNLLVDIGSKQLDEGTRLQLKMADDGRVSITMTPVQLHKHDTYLWLRRS